MHYKITKILFAFAITFVLFGCADESKEEDPTYSCNITFEGIDYTLTTNNPVISSTDLFWISFDGEDDMWLSIELPKSVTPGTIYSNSDNSFNTVSDLELLFYSNNPYLGGLSPAYDNSNLFSLTVLEITSSSMTVSFNGYISDSLKKSAYQISGNFTIDID